MAISLSYGLILFPMSDSFEAQATNALAELGEILGLEDLEFHDEDDTCLLELDGKTKIAITLNEERGEIVIHLLVGQLPEENRYDVVEQLLEANLFWAGTRGATLSIERERGDVFLTRALSVNGLDGAALGTAIADLASSAEQWSSLLKQNITSEEEAVRVPSSDESNQHAKNNSEIVDTTVLA